MKTILRTAIRRRFTLLAALPAAAQPDGVILGAGAQLIKPSRAREAAQDPGLPGTSRMKFVITASRVPLR